MICLAILQELFYVLCMKSLFIAVLLSILFTGCEPNKSSSTNTDNVQTTPEESQEEVIQVTEEVDTAINEEPDQDKNHPGVKNDILEFFNTVDMSYRIGGDLPKSGGMVIKGLYYDFTFDVDQSQLEFWHRRLAISDSDYLTYITQVEKYSINVPSLNKYLEIGNDNSVSVLTLKSENALVFKNTSVISYTHELQDEYDSDNALDDNSKFELLRSQIEAVSYLYKTCLEAGLSVAELVSLYENETNQKVNLDLDILDQINASLGEDVMIALKPDIMSRFKIALTDLMAECGNTPLKY